ncbi:MAG: ABC transporter permease [Alphaproteobacteria bacterium]|nr:ABC transporter permease [Alphaproteobacteria bacterium]
MIRAVAILAGKDFALLWRDRPALFWTVVFPVLVAVGVGAMFGGAPATALIPVQVLDLGDAGRARMLDELPGVRAVRAESEPAGEAAVRAGRAAALVVLRPGEAVELRGDLARNGEVELLRALVAGMAAARPPVAAIAGGVDRPRTPFERSVAAGMAWALIGAAASFALSLAREVEAGMFLRLGAAPITRLDVLLGKALACWIACFGELLLLALLGAALGAMRPGDLLAPAMAVAAAATCFAGLMLLTSQLGRGEMQVAASAWGAMLVLALFGGAILPQAMLPEWMQAIGQASPVRWAMQALDTALGSGQGWRAVARSSAMLAATGAVGVALGFALFLRRAR